MLKGEVERARRDLNSRSSDRQSDVLSRAAPRALELGKELYPKKADVAINFWICSNLKLRQIQWAVEDLNP